MEKRKLLYVFIAVLLAVAIYYFIRSAPDQRARRRTQSIYAWNFGQAKEGSVLRHDFILNNDTAKPFNVLTARTTCGCTVARARKNKLLPGESTAIEVKFDTRGYSGQTRQVIYVVTDRIDKSLIKYIIKADITK